LTWAIAYATAGFLYLEWELQRSGPPPDIDLSNGDHLFAWYAAGTTIFIGWPVWLAVDIWRNLTR
jgi:hypothetical protein